MKATVITTVLIVGIFTLLILGYWEVVLGLIITGVLLFILFGFLIGVSLTLGMRNKQDTYYDPETKQWYPKMYMTEEQISRIRKGKRKLAKRKC